MSILSLPPELRTHILQYWEKADLKKFSLCSKQCRQDILPILWHDMRIDWMVLSRHLPTKEHLKQVSSLELYSNISPHRHAPFKDRAYDSFSTLLDQCSACRLRSINFRRFLVNDGLQLLLKKFPLIESLKLYNIRASGSNWNSITAYHHLRELYIGYCDVRDEHIANIGSVRCLQKLSIVGCDHLTGLSLKYISQVTLLRSFTFACCPSICSAEYVGLIQQMKGLKELEIYNTGSLDDIFCQKALKHSNLLSLHIRWTSVSDAGLSYIAGVKFLTDLDISACNITDVGVECISSLSLQFLDISFCNGVTERGLHYLGKMKSLFWLAIDHCSSITDRGIMSLVGLSSLRNLSMAYCNLSDCCVDSILQLPLLKDVDISGNYFSDDGVNRLSMRVRVIQYSHFN